ncbi:MULTISPECIES: hypothetical protein [unclassified Actinomyces]|uniref:hypothetical protein n=1 Tax=unclassified Actinomyces TaxID=2609248 RepID=UPI00135994D9|nr:MULTISPECIES: hypothetical protein [unclassified Actinomyces]
MSLLSKILADIRTVIAAVLGIFGLFLLVCSGFLNGEDEMAKTGGVNANLWAGIALVVVAVLMALWWGASPGDSGKGSDGSPSDPGAQRQG